jgi:hypothetical protein
MGEMRNAYRILMEKLIGRVRRGWEDKTRRISHPSELLIQFDIRVVGLLLHL